MKWFEQLMAWLFKVLFAPQVKVLFAPQVARVEHLEKFQETQANENLDVHEHLKDLEKRWERLARDGIPPNVVTIDSLCLIEMRHRLNAIEKHLGLDKPVGTGEKL